ncbi:MAG: hypothetical protein ACI9N3_000919 [Colwellia sp.]|jgi:hypothetical protein
MVVIALGSVKEAAFQTQTQVLVACIVKLDDLVFIC